MTNLTISHTGWVYRFAVWGGTRAYKHTSVCDILWGLSIAVLRVLWLVLVAVFGVLFVSVFSWIFALAPIWGLWQVLNGEPVNNMAIVSFTFCSIGIATIGVIFTIMKLWTNPWVKAIRARVVDKTCVKVDVK